MPPSAVFFGADYVGGVELQSSANGFSAEMESKTMKIERERSLNLKHSVEHVDNQN